MLDWEFLCQEVRIVKIFRKEKLEKSDALIQ